MSGLSAGECWVDSCVMSGERAILEVGDLMPWDGGLQRRKSGAYVPVSRVFPGEIQRMVVGGRGTYYCPVCQRTPPPRLPLLTRRPPPCRSDWPASTPPSVSAHSHRRTLYPCNSGAHAASLSVASSFFDTRLPWDSTSVASISVPAFTIIPFSSSCLFNSSINPSTTPLSVNIARNRLIVEWSGVSS